MPSRFASFRAATLLAATFAAGTPAMPYAGLDDTFVLVRDGASYQVLTEGDAHHDFSLIDAASRYQKADLVLSGPVARPLRGSKARKACFVGRPAEVCRVLADAMERHDAYGAETGGDRGVLRTCRYINGFAGAFVTYSYTLAPAAAPYGIVIDGAYMPACAL